MKINKDREPIALRTKALKDGRQSLYLDFYDPDGGRNHQHRYEFLKLYLLPDRRDTREANRATLAAANAIKAQRLLERANNKASITAKTNLCLLDYIDVFIADREKMHAPAGTITWYKAFRNKVQKLRLDVPLSRLDVPYLKTFITTISNSGNLNATKNTRTIKKATAHHYFGSLVSVLNQAVRDGIIASNPTELLSKEDKKQVANKPANRAYLTAEELQLLLDTPIKQRAIKTAFMFAAFTGLRWCDMEKLRWDDIYKDGEKHYIRIEMKKTKREVIVPLSKTALSFLPPAGAGLVYPELKAKKNTRYYALKKWAEKAGIKKDICFHVSRHTFATSLLTQGADIYTTSKLLGHTSVATTQIYAEIVNKKKEEAINLLDNINLKRD